MRSLILLIAIAWLASDTVATTEQSLGASVSVEGKIFLPEGVRLPAHAEVHVRLENGRTLITYPSKDGRFTLFGVPDGTHTLEVQAQPYIFPVLKLVTDGTQHKPVSASLPEIPGTPLIGYPLLLRPALRAEYFETRKPINVLGFLKTPYGMMAAFMVFSMVILPKLKVDPEEYRRVMGQESEGGGHAAAAGGGGSSRDRRD